MYLRQSVTYCDPWEDKGCIFDVCGIMWDLVPQGSRVTMSICKIRGAHLTRVSSTIFCIAPVYPSIIDMSDTSLRWLKQSATLGLSNSPLL